MLIKPPAVKWTRDPAVSDLIDHLAQKELQYPNKQELLASLRIPEIRAIEKELEFCRQDFSYAARNYFWIEDKETRQDILFRLLESQELIYTVISEMKAAGKSQRVLLIKARQLGASTLVEGMIAWRTIFFQNINAFIVSHKDSHAHYLFAIMQKILDRMPWWLQPMVLSRKIEDGLIFDNPDHEDRKRMPGLNSKITVDWATANTSIGMGVRLSAFHGSEFASWPDGKAKEIISRDILNAMSDGPETFAILESTAKGAGRYAHKLWVDMVELGEKAGWRPLFLPWFFDRHRRISIGLGWKPKREEVEMREKAARDWTRCNNKLCLQYHRRAKSGQDIAGSTCPTCQAGVLVVHAIPDAQLAWMEDRRLNVKNDDESLSLLAQEQATTAEEAFVITGLRVFGDASVKFASLCIREPIAAGYLDNGAKFHGVNLATGRCFHPGCNMDHRGDDMSLYIWEFPEVDGEYVVGADVSEGLGQDDSAAAVLLIGKHGTPDRQVASWARNDVSPIDYAEFLARLGYYYNTGMLSVEKNKPDTTANWLRVRLQYPNLYRTKNHSNLNVEGYQVHWTTNIKTKRNLSDTLRKFLNSRLVIIRDRVTVNQITTFQKEYDSESTGAAKGFKDDKLLSMMIAVYTAHEMDWDEDAGLMRTVSPLSRENAPYIFLCLGCSEEFYGKTIRDYRKCPKCSTMHISARANTDPNAAVVQDPDADLLKEDDIETMFPELDAYRSDDDLQTLEFQEFSV